MNLEEKALFLLKNGYGTLAGEFLKMQKEIDFYMVYVNGQLRYVGDNEFLRQYNYLVDAINQRYEDLNDKKFKMQK